MAMHAQITTINGDVWLTPITLKVCADWEHWSGKTLQAMTEPTALDFAYLCWRAAIYAKQISKRTSLDAFAKMVNGWEIVNITPNGVDQLEEWLKEQ
jgi:hypothetical protein